jgi:HPt (histidine-containing phosphotransfer) domain-containing protein
MTSPTTGSSIPELPGLDLSTSLHRVGNNWALLQNILFIFMRSHQSTFEQFMSASAASDWSTAIRISHTVKGSSATIGALRLAEVAGEIENHLKAENFHDAALLHARFKFLFEETLSSLEKFKAAQDTPSQDNLPAEPSNKQELLQLTEDLIRNLSDDLSKAEEQIKKFSSIKQHYFTDENFCTELRLAFEHFNFPKVKSLLKNFHETLLSHSG